MKPNTKTPKSSKTIVQPSYTQRLINRFKDEDEDEPLTINQIEAIILNFSKMEFEKRKKQTDQMPFGKYKHKLVKDVAAFDKQYLIWLRKQDMLDNYQELKEEINKYI